MEEDYNIIMSHLSYFVLFVVVILLLASVVLKALTKKYKFTASKSRFYGLLFNLSNENIIALSLTSLNYLFLVWCAMTLPKLNYLYASLLIIMPLIANVLNKNYIKIPISLIVSLVNAFAIYIMNFVHVYLRGELEDIYMRGAIFGIVGFAFVYFTYNYINDFNDIVKNDTKKGGNKNAA